MATPELAPGEAHDVDGIIMEGRLEYGECTILTIADGWKRREANLNVNLQKTTIDGLEHEPKVPNDEKTLVFNAIAKLIQQTYPEIAAVEDPYGNLL